MPVVAAGTVVAVIGTEVAGTGLVPAGMAGVATGTAVAGMVGVVAGITVVTVAVGGLAPRSVSVLPLDYSEGH